MFGYITPSDRELSSDQKHRYQSIYCGICRSMGERFPQIARLGLQYDCAFLAMLLMSLYEPEESAKEGRCLPHPVKKRTYVDNEFIRYAADMNVALMCYKALDDWNDDKKLTGKAAYGVLRPCLPDIRERWPEQCAAIESSLQKLSLLEKENCPNPDLPAGVFGELMAALFLCRKDRWQETLSQMGHALGRFIYLADAACDYLSDSKKGRYNPYLAMGAAYEPRTFREHLVLSMSRCCEAYEVLPLVQDKEILDNILYSGLWSLPNRKLGNYDGRSV